VYPPALSEMIGHISKEYPGVPLYVTENGCSYGDGRGRTAKSTTRGVSFLRRFISRSGMR